MFCSNCGNQLADGAKFCSHCGAKVETPAASIVTEERTSVPQAKAANAHMNLEWGSSEPIKPKKAVQKRMSFDWSSVIDEGPRRPRRDIRSPWDDDNYDDVVEPAYGTDRTAGRESLEEDIFTEASAPAKDDNRGRTLTFIDILKQEREDKERQQYESVRRNREIDQPDYDYTSVSNTILPEEERVLTKGYTDLKTDIIAEMASDAEPAFDKQLEKAKKKRAGFVPEPPKSFVDGFFRDPSPKQPAPHDAPEELEPEEELEEIISSGEAILDEPERIVPDFSDETISEASEEISDIDNIDETDEIEDIEEIEVEVPEVEPIAEAADEEEDLFDDYGVEEDVEVEAEETDPYSDYEDYVPVGRAARHRFNDDLDDEDLYDEDLDDELEEVAETPELAAEDEKIKAVDDEIAELQRKLNELMGIKNAAEEPAAEEAPEEPAVVIEEYDEEEAAVISEEPETEDYLVDEDVFDADLKIDEDDEDEDELTADIKLEFGAPAESDDESEEIIDDITDDAAEESISSTIVAEDAYLDDSASEEASSVEDLLSELLPEEATRDESVSEMTMRMEAITDEMVEADKAAQSPLAEDMPDYSEVEMDYSKSTEDYTFGGDMDEMDLDKELSDLGFNSIELDATPEDVESINAVLGGDIGEADLDSELSSLGFDAIDVQAADEEKTYSEEYMLFTPETTDVSESSDTVLISQADLDAQEAMSIEELERDLFGTTVDSAEPETTKKIEKFYTLYRKNEEFQRLLSQEYDKLQSTKYVEPTPENELLVDEPDVDELTGLADLNKVVEEDVVVVEAEPEPERKAPVMEESEAKAGKKNAKADKNAKAKASKEAKKAAKKARRLELDEDDDEDDAGGSILTVLAIVVAVLLVVLLVIILILNFAPESGIAQSLNGIIGNFSNFFSANDSTELLL